jgi:hypothetical protein
MEKIGFLGVLLSLNTFKANKAKFYQNMASNDEFHHFN